MARPPADQPLLTPERISGAALRLIDQDGVEALSMRRLAGELGVNPKSMYHYYPNKEALLQAVYLSILGELELPDETAGDWETRLRILAHSFRRLTHRHPSFITHFFQPHELTARELDVFDALYALFRQAGLPGPLVLQTGRVLITFLTGFILAELNGNFVRHAVQEQRQAALRQPERYSNILELPLPPAEADPDASFEIALGVVIAGLQHRAP